jgi:alpha-2-macroglobulin
VVRTREKVPPDFVARVTLGGKEIAHASFERRTTEVFRRVVPMAELKPSPDAQPLIFTRDGKSGILYYGAVLRYVPAEAPRQPLERGLFVQRWFEPYEGGGQVRAARAGDLVRVRVRIGTPQERHFVAVSVPVPAGLEIVDTSLASTARAPEQSGDEGPGEDYDPETADAAGDEDAPGPSIDAPWAYRFWSPFNHEEKRDDRLVLFADELPPGLHVVSFVARATTPGTFVLPPAHAEEMYTPEVFGRSDGGAFEVRVDDGMARR